MKKFKYDNNGRVCNFCKNYKFWDSFSIAGNIEMPNNRRSQCKDCLNKKRKPLTEDQKRRKRHNSNIRRVKGIKEAIKLTGNFDCADNGFIYLYRCDELDCFKIGKTKANPFDYISTKSRDYGLDLKMVAYIVSPVRDYDAEWLATKDLKHKRIKHVKPNRGVAHELFRCGLYEAINILRGISDKMYIEPNPFVTLEDLDAVEIVEYIPTKEERYHSSKKFSGVVARRMLREIRDRKVWNVNCGDYISTCECRQVKFSRGLYIDKKGEAYFSFSKKDIYLGKHGFDKGEIINKFKSVYDLRDSLFINGRYLEGSESVIRDKIKEIKLKS